MSVANLPRYNMSRWMLLGDRHTVSTLDPSGEWVRFEEAVEASSNSLQQLKAEIAAVADRVSDDLCGNVGTSQRWLIDKLRQLSAV